MKKPVQWDGKSYVYFVPSRLGLSMYRPICRVCRLVDSGQSMFRYLETEDAQHPVRASWAGNSFERPFKTKELAFAYIREAARVMRAHARSDLERADALEKWVETDPDKLP